MYLKHPNPNICSFTIWTTNTRDREIGFSILHLNVKAKNSVSNTYNGFFFFFNIFPRSFCHHNSHEPYPLPFDFQINFRSPLGSDIHMFILHVFNKMDNEIVEKVCNQFSIQFIFRSLVLNFPTSIFLKLNRRSLKASTVKLLTKEYEKFNETGKFQWAYGPHRVYICLDTEIELFVKEESNVIVTFTASKMN